MCFGETTGCYEPLSAYDYEEGRETEINISSIQYSKDNSKYSNTTDYEVVASNGGFKISSIRFDKVGYYRVTMQTKDASEKVRQIVYLIRVIDDVKPVYSYEYIDKYQKKYQ